MLVKRNSPEYPWTEILQGHPPTCEDRQTLITLLMSMSTTCAGVTASGCVFTGDNMGWLSGFSIVCSLHRRDTKRACLEHDGNTGYWTTYLIHLNIAYIHFNYIIIWLWTYLISRPIALWYSVCSWCDGTYWYVSCSSQCSKTGVTKAVVCAILSLGWCI